MVAEPQVRAAQSAVDAFYEDLASAQVSAYWQVIPRLPKHERWAHVWKWREIEPLVLRAGTVVDPAEAERRVMILASPQNPAGTTATLTASIQLVLAGEAVPTHRHTMTAIRHIISGSGAATDIEGERFPLEPNDLVLTPSWTWHSHTNPAADPIIWLDGLDAPLVRGLRADLFQNAPDPYQQITRPADYTRGRIGNGVVRPANVELEGRVLPIIYRWSDVYPELMRHAPEAGASEDGIVLDYVNPSGARSTLPTLNCQVQLLAPGQSTRRRRHMGSVVFRAIEGSGRTVVDDTTLEWDAGDIFSVPAWSWYDHVNTQAGNAILFSYTDAPVLQALGLYREEAQ